MRARMKVRVSVIPARARSKRSRSNDRDHGGTLDALSEYVANRRTYSRL